jgi:hypothetical protein
LSTPQSVTTTVPTRERGKEDSSHKQSNSELGKLFSTRSLGPLRVHPDNPRYFAASSGRAIYLTGSHTWSNLQGPKDPPTGSVYVRYLGFLRERNHNFIRLWA